MDKFKSAYLLFSFLAGFVELGAVLLVVRQGYPLYYVALAGLAYQLGALFREPIALASWQYYLVLLLSGILAAFAAQLPVLLCVAVFLFSIGLQGARGLVSEHQSVSTALKRLSRVAGFACSGLLFPWVLTVMGGVVLLVVFVLSRDLKSSRKAVLRKGMQLSPLSLVMLIHQSHYFCYSYIIPLMFVMRYQVSPAVAGLVFCVGWVSYILSQPLFGDKNLVLTFAGGHVFASITLVAMFLFSSRSFLILILLWFLTGFGGGTVYCLRKLKEKSVSDKSDLDSWENIGHVLGVLICLLVLLISGTPQLAFAVAAFIAAVTCVLFLAVQKKPTVVKR